MVGVMWPVVSASGWKGRALSLGEWVEMEERKLERLEEKRERAEKGNERTRREVKRKSPTPELEAPRNSPLPTGVVRTNRLESDKNEDFNVD